MSGLTVKHTTKDPRTGNILYRRRVPKALQGHFVGQGYLVKALGKGDAAIHAYSEYHGQIEQLLALAKNGVTGLSPLEQQKRLKALFETWGADPNSSGRDENEQTWREVEADRLVERYQNPLTGEYEGVPEEVRVKATVLLQGLSKEPQRVTVTDAFKAVLPEKLSGTAEQQKKVKARYNRVENALLSAMGEDKPLSEVTRTDVRAWRDMRISQGKALATIRREKNDLSGVFSWAISELDGAGDNNPFLGLKLGKDSEGRQQKRDPLPQDIIDAVYNDLEKRPDLLRFWTLLDWTGARPSEIRLLQASEVVLDGEIPHLVIQEREDRTLKTAWSIRKIPLLGHALEAASEAVEGKAGEALIFPSYSKEGGMDRLSTALRKPVRAYTKNPKHVPYSLRHNFVDRLRIAHVPRELGKALEGHSYSAGQDASYGNGYPLWQLREALESAFSGYRGWILASAGKKAPSFPNA